MKGDEGARPCRVCGTQTGHVQPFGCTVYARGSRGAVGPLAPSEARRSNVKSTPAKQGGRRPQATLKDTVAPTTNGSVRGIPMLILDVRIYICNTPLHRKGEDRTFLAYPLTHGERIESFRQALVLYF